MAAPRRIGVVHWKPEEIKDALRRLGASGDDVIVAGKMSPAVFRRWREASLDAVIIDLSRRPSHGRAVGVALRESAVTRHVPLLFVEGEPEQVERVRAALPDATFTRWRGMRGALTRALARLPVEPVVASTRTAGYPGTPLPKKLGVKPGRVVVLVGPPEGFRETLGQLPEGVDLKVGASARGNLTVWFVGRRADFVRALPSMVEAAARGPLWIAWPKQGSSFAVDLAQAVIREHALAAGLVDYKVCAIDEDWSGLAFRVRKAQGAHAVVPPAAC